MSVNSHVCFILNVNKTLGILRMFSELGEVMHAFNPRT